MANIVQVEATNQLNASLGKATYTATVTPMMLRLMSTNGSATAAGTEVANSGGSTYAAQNLTTALGTASAGSITTTSAVTHTNMPAITTVGVEIWDSAGTPIRKWFGALSASKTTALGDSLSFAASSITISTG